METLRTYLNSLPTEQQETFAKQCGTSVGYLRKAMSIGQKLGESICIDIERATNGAVTCEDLRPDLADRWAYLRGTNCQHKEAA